MPVIVLGGRSSLPIDPTFDDGGNIQTIGSLLEDSDGFSTSAPNSVVGTSVITGSGGASFNGSITSTIPTDIVDVAGGFTIDVVQVIGATPTPNIVPPPAAPGVSPPGGSPTTGDFDDDGVIQNMGTSVVAIAGGFINPASEHVVGTLVSSVPVGSDAFTNGTVTNGTTPATNIDPILSGAFDGLSADAVHVQTTLVLS